MRIFSLVAPTTVSAPVVARTAGNTPVVAPVPAVAPAKAETAK